MHYSPNIKNEDFKITKFIDFDKINEQFYNNFYLNDLNIVVKMPLKCKNKMREDIRI